MAPDCRASWTAIEPTPPAAPETATVSPPVRPTARTAAYAVVPATNSAPASSHGTPAGLAVRCCSSTTTYSAWLPRLSAQPMTSNRGRLRIYLGYAPGAGTTFALLSEGHRRSEHGTDVVVAIAETHGRPHTEALLAGLEIIPPAKVPCPGHQV